MEEHFIREKIVGPKGKWKKRLKKAVLLLFSGGLFGMAAALSFFFMEKRLSPKETEQPKESIALVEESSEAVPETVAETEAIEDVVQSELQKFDFSVSSYDSLMSNAKTLISEGEKSLVEIRIHTPGQDSLSEDNLHCAGVILKKTKEEAVILFLGEAKADAVYEVEFNREKKLPASLRGKSGRDRWVILSVELSSLSEKEWEKIQEMPRGNSRLLQKGDTVLLLGSPLGQAYSTALSNIGALSYDKAAEDRVEEEIKMQFLGEADSTAFVLNTKGEWVGFFTEAEDRSSGRKIIGISDALESLERLSNGGVLPYFGVKIQNSSKAMQELGIPEGVYVTEVVEDSPAYSTGILPGDIIKKLNGKSVETSKAFQDSLMGQTEGAVVPVELLRYNGKEYVELVLSCPIQAR